MNSLDFTSGIDFTGLPSITGADINTGIANGIPLKDTDETVGKGLSITTTDSALNTPDVPNPTTSADFEKWKRYIWIRRPFAGADNKAGTIYIWNDDADNDAIYLKWLQMTIDLTTIVNSVNNALATADSAVALAEVANDTANSANNTATNAANQATDSVITANAANALATTANTTANHADAAATVAQTTANTGVTLNTTPIAIDQRLLPSATPFQQIRVRADIQKVEWFSPRANYAKATEIYAKGTDNPTVPAVGKNTRLFNTLDNNTGNIATLNPVTGVIGLAAPNIAVGGAVYYRIKAWAIINRSGANALAHQLIIANNTSNATILTGASFSLANGNTNNVMAIIEGILAVTGAADSAIRLDHYTSTATGIVLGKAANVHPDVGGSEIYAGIEIELLGS